jgi:hypothetical protein
MRRQSFYQLSRIIQDRFIAATEGHTIPKPILVASVGSENVPVYWATAAGGALLLALVVLGLGYGDSSSSIAIAPLGVTLLHALLLAVAAWAGITALARWKSAAATPYRRAHFLFPSGVIDTSGKDFRIFPLSECSSIEVVAQRNVVLQFPEARFTFEAETAEAARAAREATVTAKRELLEREIEGSENARHDPLAEPRYSSPLSSRVMLAPPAGGIPIWLKWGIVVLSFALGIGLTSMRNVLSERRMFARAVAENTAQAYRAYQARGGKREQVDTLLLPRAELTELANAGNLEELERYAAAHQDSLIKSEIDHYLRVRLLEELKLAADQKTLAALAAFEHSHPVGASLVQTDVKAARRALLIEAFERFVPRAADTPGLVPFMRAVLNHVAEHGPRFEVRFQRSVAESAVRADRLVREDKYFNAALVPSQYFDDNVLEPWFESIFQRVFKGLGLSFPTDVLDIQRGAALPPDVEPPGDPSTPTLLVSLSTNMGRGIKNRNPSGTFFGVGFQFRARLLLAGAEPVELKYSLWKPPDLLKLREGKLTVREVYEDMSEDAFKGFDRKLGNWLFKR